MIYKLKINEISLNISKNLTILQLCENLNIYIPRFCFHSRLSIAGNCRMCLIELKNSPKPVISCAMPIANNMEIYTNTPLIKKTRETILEFLLINHPLDCPICDQGGECDLQEQTLHYGADRTKYFFKKRSVQNKNFGIFIKTVMTRCIHCTRCIRFLQEYTNNAELGTIGRGSITEITNFLYKNLNTELSGNIIDLCPVGALTSKPFAFKARSWEIKKYESIDCLDSFGSNIRIDVLNNKILRITPSKNPFLNDCWISDKTRFAYDALIYQRIINPLIKKNNKFIEVTWFEILNKIKKKIEILDATQIASISDNYIDLKSIFLKKLFFSKLGIKNIYSIQKSYNNVDFYSSNIFMSNYKSLDYCLLIFCNPRYENTTFNIFLKNISTLNKISIASIGYKFNSIYNINYLGNNLKIVLQIIEGKHFINKILKKKKNSLIILGQEFFNQKNNEIYYNFLTFYSKIKLNILYTEISCLNYIENNFKTYQNQLNTNLKLLFLFNINNLNKINKLINNNLMIIYHGTHYPTNLNHFNIILPSLTYFEKTSYFLNNFGQLKKTNKIIQNNLPSDIQFFKFFFLVFNFSKNINFLFFLMPHLKNFSTKNLIFYKNKIILSNKKINILNINFKSNIKNYFLNDNITKNSKLMALRTQNLQNSLNNLYI